MAEDKPNPALVEAKFYHKAAEHFEDELDYENALHEYEKAAHLYEQAKKTIQASTIISIFKSSVTCWAKVAQYRARYHDFKAAAEIYEKLVIATEPTPEPAYMTKAVMCKLLDDRDGAGKLLTSYEENQMMDGSFLRVSLYGFSQLSENYRSSR